VRILIDLQPLQTLGAATRGVGRYTNGLLSALASFHDVIGMRRSCPYLVPPSADVPTVEVTSGRPETELEQQLSDWHFDVVINCSGPFWEENVIVSGLRNTNRPIVASIFYDVIPWVFPDVYLQDPQVRRGYHNRCVDLYARADLVCAISQHSEHDALRFGYATNETATTISLGVERLVPEVTNTREKWKIPRSYLLSVSGDEFRKNPEMLIAAFLQSHIRKSRCLVVIISNDADSGFSLRMETKYGNLRAQGVIILPEVGESELGVLYRDCEAFVYTSLYEGFGIPIVEAMRFGKWIISSRSSSLAEVSGPALLSVIEDPSNLHSIITALDQAVRRLDEGRLDEMVPQGHAQKFSWTQVVRNFETAVAQRKVVVLSTRTLEQPRLFWASPLPNDVSGIAFYSEDLVGPVSKDYDIILVPNTVSTFVPTPKTGRFKIEEPRAEALRALCNDEQPFVFYNIGNSHFHLELLDLLFTLRGIVLLHDSFVGGIEGLWRERNAGLAMDQNFTTRPAATAGLRRWCWTLSKMDRLLLPFQPTRFRRILSMVARLSGMRRLVLDVAEFLRGVSAGKGASLPAVAAAIRSDTRSLDVQIIESSWAMLFLGEHAKSLIGLKHLAKRPTHVVPLYCRHRGAISATKRSELRRKYDIPEDAFVVTTTGFQASIKLPDRIVQGCVELKDFENALVYVQVLGHFFEASLKTKITTLLKKNDVRAFVSDGFVDEETLAQRVALSDVVVFLRGGTTGGPSAGLNDALGMGIPGLVTDDFAFREYPKTAVLHVSNTEVTEGLILLYRHPEIRQALGAGGLQYAQEMSLEGVAARLCKIFSLYRQNRSTRSRANLVPMRKRALRADRFRAANHSPLHRSTNCIGVRWVGARLLRPFSTLRERIRRALLRADTLIPAALPNPDCRQRFSHLPVSLPSGLGVVKALSAHAASESELDGILHAVRYRIMEELDRYVGEQQIKPGNTLELELSGQGLFVDSSVYRVDALRRLPEIYLFEALSVLLFKRPLKESQLLHAVNKLSRRRLTVLLICSLLPGRRARIAGLYRQALRSVVSKSPFIFALAKKIYYRIT
jgi:glycosyltransferase involved in cell wall biosynthesis